MPIEQDTLHVLVVDPSDEQFGRLSNALRGSALVASVQHLSTLDAVRNHLSIAETDVIYIDPLAIGVDEASRFIFHARSRTPGLVFTLYMDVDRARATPNFYAGERARFFHYYKLDKSLSGDRFAQECQFTLHQCHSDIRNEYSFRRTISRRELAAGGIPPVEITESLALYRETFAVKTAFIMMQFGHTSSHKKIEDSIQEALNPFDIQAVRADGRRFHRNLLLNVMTYAHGCTFGIAVFERIKEDVFNPNVSLEVGYMMALRKPLCLLKDQTLRTLQADLIGELYEEFDPAAPLDGIRTGLSRWIADQAFSEGLTNR